MSRMAFWTCVLLAVVGAALLLVGLTAMPASAVERAVPALQPSPRPPWNRPPWNATMTPTPGPTATPMPAPPTPYPTPTPTSTPTPTPTSTPVPLILPASGCGSQGGWLLGLGIGFALIGLALVVLGSNWARVGPGGEGRPASRHGRGDNR